MRLLSAKVLIGLVLVLLSPVILPTSAQQPMSVSHVVQITGLTGVKDASKGSLTVDKESLQFAGSKMKAEVAIASLQDVVTGNDSQRVIRGTIGTLSMFAPYGGGRFLSLFRSKIDTLTIQYRDADGGLHGAIFTMPVGKADLLKKELIARGAHTSIPFQEDSNATGSKPATAKEQKP
jgi:hypothetical protein